MIRTQSNYYYYYYYNNSNNGAILSEDMDQVRNKVN